MISFFPTPYEDETLHSVIARYHLRSGNQSSKSTLQELFSQKTVTATVDLPSHIGELIDNLPLGNQMDAEYLIKHHTLYPFYTAFLDSERKKKIFNSMAEGKGASIHNSAGIMASSIKANKYLKFCPLCFKEEADSLGEPYWHRAHQIPTIPICHKHRIPLQNSQVLLKPQNKHQFIAATKENCVIQSSDSYAEETIKILFMLAKNAYVILQNNFNNIGEFNIKNKYYARLQEKRFATVNSRIYRTESTREFKKFFGSELLQLTQSDFDSEKNSNWLLEFLTKQDRAMHPTRHLLLAMFLNISLYELFSGETKFNTFGAGPWPCLNKVSDHYQQLTIPDIIISHSSDAKKPIATYNCSKCGFVYKRTMGEKNYRVIDYGFRWREKLKELSKKGLSLREKARILGVDPKTVKKYLEKDKRRESPKENKERITKDKENYRTSWLVTIAENREKGKTQVRKLNQRAYSWLYKNDRDWLIQNSPASTPAKQQNIKVDWRERDKRVSEMVKEVVDEKLSSESKPEKITKSKIGKELGIQDLLQKHLSKMPKTKHYLTGVLESDYTFRKRRVKWAITELERKNKSLKKWEIYKQAGIRKEYKQELDEFVDELISDREN
ncbi:TnsD family transposase [Proteinivorax tanatarense]|uniref:TnsD family transposase n=1 Tax=Proteinivorax tanatarense TaxID=1260629 RepID=A0AAU7VMK6_9FIRM